MHSSSSSAVTIAATSTTPTEPVQIPPLMNMPNEILLMVLKNLDIKKLATLRTVNKRFREMIDSPDFIKSLLNVKFSTQNNTPEDCTQIEAYQTSILNALKGNDSLPLKTYAYMQKVLERQLQGGVVLAGSSFIWLKNNLWGCGSNACGVLGLGYDITPRTTFARVGGPGLPPWGTADILGVASGGLHSLVWADNGLWASGDNKYSQLGLGLGTRQAATFERVRAANSPARWGDATILGVAAGVFHSVVWTNHGIWVCGDNTHGQLGVGAANHVRTFAPVGGAGLPPWGTAAILGVAAGIDHIVVWTAQGLWVCGSNQYGQLGLGDYIDRIKFTRVGGTGLPPWGTAAILGVVTGHSFSTTVWTTQGLYVCGKHLKNATATFTRVGDKGLPPWGTAVVLGVTQGLDCTFVDTTQGFFARGENESGALGVGNKTTYESFIPIRSELEKTNNRPLLYKVASTIKDQLDWLP